MKIKKILSIFLMLMLVSVGVTLADNTTGVTQLELPELVIALAEEAPAGDSIIGMDLAVQIKKAGYEELPLGTYKLFKTVDKDEMKDQVTVLIYKGDVKIVVGSQTTPDYLTFAVALVKMFDNLGVNTGNVLLDTQVPNDYRDLFIEEDEDDIDSIILARETVKCVFHGSTSQQSCYLASENDDLGCSGTETCSVEIFGEKGDKKIWKSTCEGYAYTTMDGDNEYAEFNCDNDEEELPDLVIDDLEFVEKYDGLATIEFDVLNKGNVDAKGPFSVAVYVNGQFQTNTLIPSGEDIEAGESYHKELSNYYWLADQGAEITVIADRYEYENNPLYENVEDNAVKESNEANNKATIILNNQIGNLTEVYNLDLVNYPELFVKDGKFNGYVVLGDKASPSDVLAASEIIQSLKEHYDGGIEVGTAKLASEITNPQKTNLITIGNPCVNSVTTELMGNPLNCAEVLTRGKGLLMLQSNEGYVQLIVAGYSDQDTSYAADVLANWKQHDLHGRKVELDTQTMETVVIYEDVKKITIPDNDWIPSSPDIEKGEGETNCQGCQVEGVCLPFGTRLVQNEVPKYCDITQQLENQKDKEISCQNNYECSTNQCNDGTCGSLSEELEETRGMLNKLLEWLGGIF